MDEHTKQDINDLRVSGTRLRGDETENRTRATRKVTMTIEAVSMTTDQFHELTRYRLDQVWPEYIGRAMRRVAMTIDQLHMVIAALRTRHRWDIEATREGKKVPKLDQVDNEATKEGEAIPKLDQLDQEDIKATREGETLPKLDQVDQGDIEATREGELVPKLDQEDQGDIEATSEGVTVPKLDQGDQGEGSEDAQVQDYGVDTNNEVTYKGMRRDKAGNFKTLDNGAGCQGHRPRGRDQGQGGGGLQDRQRQGREQDHDQGQGGRKGHRRRGQDQGQGGGGRQDLIRYFFLKCT